MTPVPPLSVVLPVHNGQPYLEQSIRSLLGQTFADFELLVADDGSTDGSSAVISRLAHQDRRIRVVRRAAKSGLAASANWAVGESRADIVAVAHADDPSYPTRLQRQMEIMSAEPGAVLIAGLSEGVDDLGRTVQPADRSRLLRKSALAPFAHSSVMFRRAAFEAVGGYRSAADYWEDLDLWWRLSGLGRILVVPEVITAYRHSPASVRVRDSSDDLERAAEIMYRATELFADGRPYDHLFGAEPGEVRPRVFVARAWPAIWQGRRPRLLGRMLRRSRLRPDPGTLLSLVFVAWATASPKSLRAAVGATIRARNAWAEPRLGAAAAHEWRPR